MTPPTAALTEQTYQLNFTALLAGRVSSQHTHRMYARWIDQYLSDYTDHNPTRGAARDARMAALPVTDLLPVLSPPMLRAWLGQLHAENLSKQTLNQARAAIVTLASILAEAGLLDDYVAMAMKNVRTPNAESGQRQGRWLNMPEAKSLIPAAIAMASSPEQAVRNEVILKLLVLMALRREEAANIRWSDFHIQNNQAVLTVHGKGRKVRLVDVPDTVLDAIERWRAYIGEPDPDSLLLRRVWRYGIIDNESISSDAIWRIVGDAAREAGLGRVAPHDLRRSIAGNLDESGIPIETISRLLGHSNVAITQRYLSKLPRANDGGVLMANMMGY